MATCAFHLEMPGELSSDLLILSLRHFIGRRGNVKKIRSENGTNFMVAEKGLKAAINEANKEKGMTEIIKKDIHFSCEFNPSGSLRTAGAWESAIKSVKKDH